MLLVTGVQGLKICLGSMSAMRDFVAIPFRVFSGESHVD
jgi:hypothetical protein